MIHSSNWKPKIFPIDGDVTPVEIDRLQELSTSTSLNRDKIKEIGRDGVVAYRSNTPTVNLTGRQLEYGSMEFYRKLTSKGDAVTQINFTDFKTPRFDIAGYETDDNDGFVGTVWYPGCRTQSLSLNIGDPEALIERNFTFVGEDDMTFKDDNKYLIYKRFALTGGSNETVALSDPSPVTDPDNSGQYLLRVVRVRSGTATILTHGTQWSYNGSGTLTINGSSTAGDVILVWYTGSSYITGVDPFSLNNTDLAGISAESVTILLQAGNTLSRLQSVALEVNLDRFDVGEIGNKDKVQFGTRDITARVTLGRILETYTIEEVLRGKAGLSYGKIDVREFSSNFSLIIKVYSDNSKTTFKLGYKVLDLSPVTGDNSTPTDDYINRGVVLEGETGFITSIEAVL